MYKRSLQYCSRSLLDKYKQEIAYTVLPNSVNSLAALIMVELKKTFLTTMVLMVHPKPYMRSLPWSTSWWLLVVYPIHETYDISFSFYASNYFKQYYLILPYTDHFKSVSVTQCDWKALELPNMECLTASSKEYVHYRDQ